MKISITLREFENAGGNPTKMNIEKTFVTYGDKHKNKPIKSITFDSNNSSGGKLWNVFFKDGSTHRYSEMWITTEVEFVLSKEYV